MTGTTNESPGVLGGRLPLISVGGFDRDQRDFYRQLQGTFKENRRRGFVPTDDNGRAIGPYNAFLHRPTLGDGYAQWSAAERRGTSLSERVREVVILTVGAAWQASYETYAHSAWARSVSVEEEVVDMIIDDRVGTSLAEPELSAHRFTRELVRTRRIASETYAQCKSRFGEDGVVDMVHLIGLYLATSVFLNAFEVPVPPSS